jgi:hypothetical protein
MLYVPQKFVKLAKDEAYKILQFPLYAGVAINSFLDAKEVTSKLY